MNAQTPNKIRRPTNERASVPSVCAQSNAEQDVHWTDPDFCHMGGMILDPITRLDALYVAQKNGEKKVEGRTIRETHDMLAGEIRDLGKRSVAYEALLMELERVSIIDEDGDLYQPDLIFSGDMATAVYLADEFADRIDFAAAVSPYLTALTRCIHIAADAHNPHSPADPIPLISDALKGAELLSSLIATLIGPSPLVRAQS